MSIRAIALKTFVEKLLIDCFLCYNSPWLLQWDFP